MEWGGVVDKQVWKEAKYEPSFGSFKKQKCIAVRVGQFKDLSEWERERERKKQRKFKLDTCLIQRQT